MEKDGYDKLAEFMGGRCGMEIFRRFREANIRNILFMGAELTDFERQWDGLVGEDIERGDNLRLSVKSMQKAGTSGIFWPKAMEYRRLLREYNEAVLQLVQMNNLEGRNKKDLDALRSFLRGKDGVNDFFRGSEALPWDERNTNDLMALSSRHLEKDVLSIWISDSLVPWLHDHFFYRSKEPISKGSNMWEYSDKKLQALAEIANNVVSAMLPILATVVLYNVRDPAAKLGTIVALNVLFALAVAALRCRRIEVFAATAAFSAVQVVFLGGSVIPGRGPGAC